MASKSPEFQELKDQNLLLAIKYAALMRALREVDALCQTEMRRDGPGRQLARRVAAQLNDLPGVATG